MDSSIKLLEFTYTEINMEEVKEYEIGETYFVGDTKIMVAQCKKFLCEDCFYKNHSDCTHRRCLPSERKDNKRVKFIVVKPLQQIK